MPVINPAEIIIAPNEMRREFGAQLVITNAYLTMLHFGKETIKRKIHQIIDYDGPIMTDSGGYQILRYGTVDVSPDDIVRYQDLIEPDIATILDVPTGINASKEFAAQTVRITLERAKQALKVRSNSKVLWCAPIQGGLFTDLVAESAREMGKLNYQIHAIGSPVELLNGYRYRELVDLVMAAKQNLPLQRPVHLFGAGHPAMMALAVAMGCDLFDSAAYVLFARGARYLTPEGTLHVDELSYLPCECPVCANGSPDKFKEGSEMDRIKLLARHNLQVTFGELRRIRQAIVEGRLWQHVQYRCRSHPRLLDAFKRFLEYKDLVERFDSVTKKSVFYYSGEESVQRPEVLRHSNRFRERYTPPPLPTLAIVSLSERGHPELEDDSIHLIKLVPPFGVVPEELEEMYPLSQSQTLKELDNAQILSVTVALTEYIRRHGNNYQKVILFNKRRQWGDHLEKACESIKEKLEIIQT